MRETRRPAAWLYAFGGLVGLFLIAPILIVIPMSFSSASLLEFPPPGWSLRWYEKFLTNPTWSEATLTSLKVGLTTAGLSAILGTAAALSLARVRPRLRSVLQPLILAPMVVPVVIIAVALFALLLPRGLTGSFQGLVIGHTVLALPFVIVTVGAGVATLDRRLEHAAASLGANGWQTFRRVTLPILAPNILIAALFAFITSWDEVVISLFMSSPVERTLPVVMFSQLRTNLDPTIAAASSVVLVVTTALLICVVFVRRVSERRAQV